jgi:putative ABC transport system permease protein
MGQGWLSVVRLRLRALIHRRRLDRDLDEELAFHLAARAEQSNQAIARRSFGNPTNIKEICRDMWTFQGFESVLHDAAYAVRALRKSPGFAAVAILTLALGIGANTAIFSVVDAILVRPLPYPDSDRLVELWGNVKRAKVERRGASIPDYMDWIQQSHSFEGLALYMQNSLTLTGFDEPERIPTEYVAHQYFSILGIAPQLGRTFRAEEDAVPQRDALVILSDRLWKRRFGGESNVLGRTIQLNGRAYSIVGVMPPEFRGIDDYAELWVPLMVGLSPADLQPPARGDRGPVVVGRLKPGVSLARAQSEMTAICKNLEAAYPLTNEARGVEISPLKTEIFGDLNKPLLVLLAAVAVVLIIACTNVTNLLLARSEARQREIAMRIALGAGRARVVRQLLTESLVMTLAGAGLGLLIAYGGVRALMSASPVKFPGYVHPAMDWRVAIFTTGISCAAAMVMGLAPAIQVRFSSLAGAFRAASSHSAGSRGGSRFRSALVISEVALAMVLLVGAGLLIRSLTRLIAIDPGYDPSHILTLRVALPRLAPGTTADAGVTGREVLRHLEQIPSVQAAALGSDVPFYGGSAMFYGAEGQAPVTAQNRPRAYIHRVTPSFFSALRARFVAGRPFAEQEMKDGSNVVIVTENLTRRFWPGQNAIGKRIKASSVESANPWLTIVGVVGELKYRGLPNNPTSDPDVFVPFSERQRQFAVLVRTSLQPGSIAANVRTTLRDADKSLVIYQVSTMDEYLAGETANSRFTGWLMGIFAGSAMLLAVIGIYGVMSYAVARRRQEIGVRVALGAARSDVLGMIVKRGMILTIAGLSLGVIAAFSLTHLMANLLYGVTSSDTISFAAAALVMLAVAFLACLIPASRAARMDAAVALRNE